MEDKSYIIVDKVKWWISFNTDGSGRFPIPLCSKDHMRLKPITSIVKNGNTTKFNVPEGLANVLSCPDCNKNYNLPRLLEEERIFVINKVDAQFFKNQKFIDLDNVAIPIAKENYKSTDHRYSATIQVMESKRGLQIVIYAGKKGTVGKAQIFVEPEIKRLAFDHTDLHPDEIFTEINAKFKDDSIHSIKKKEEDEK